MIINESFFRKHNKIAKTVGILTLIFMPIILICITLNLFGLIIYSKEAIYKITVGSEYKNIELKDFITYYIYFATIVVTGYFSFQVLQSSERSLELSKNIESKEKNRELEGLKENALIVYYDLYLGLNDVRTLYIGQSIFDMDNTPELMFLSNDWIKNVAVLRNELEKKDKSDCIDYIQEIYLLYGQLFTIKYYLEKIKTDKSTYEKLLKNSIINLAESLMKNDFEQLKSIEKYYGEHSEMINGDENYQNYKNGLFTITDANVQKKFDLYPAYSDSRQKWISLKCNKLDYNTQDISDTYKNILIKLDDITNKKNNPNTI